MLTDHVNLLFYKSTILLLIVVNAKKGEALNFHTKLLLQLFSSFFRIGLFTFGGGYAMLTVLEDEVVTKRNWVTHREMLDFYAIAQTTPGVIMVNVATFIGFKEARYCGALFATLAVITPSLFIISILATLLENFSDNPTLQKALFGINITVAALLTSALVRLWQQSVKSIHHGVILLISFLLVQVWGISASVIIPSAAIVGMVLSKRSSKQ